MPLSLFHPTLEVPDDTATFEGSEVDLTSVFRDADPADTYTATIDWGDGTVDQVAVSASPAFNTPLTIRIDYSQDFNNFFDTQQKRDLLQLAADTVVSRFADTLAAIRPGGDNTWEAIFTHPATGLEARLSNLTIQGNEILVFAGGRELESPSLGSGGFGGFSAVGSQSFLATAEARGESGALIDGNETDIGPWGGSISFSTRSNVRWHFGDTTDGLQAGETDFLTVAMHEMGHLFGFGTARSWSNRVNDVLDTFTGPVATAEYDESGNPPLNASADHWAEGTEDDGAETSMDPTIASNRRKLFTPLDFAALDDVGWNLVPRRQGNVTGSHAYADDGVYSITVTVTDSTGRSGSESLEVTVNNLVPVVTATGDQSIHAGQLLTITNIATFTDAGFDNPSNAPPTTETFVYAINWGDGSPLDTGAATVDRLGGQGVLTTGSFDASHTFADDGVYEVVVGVHDDDDDNFGTSSFSVIVFTAVEAVIDDFSTDNDTPFTQSAPGVLDNDEGDLLRVTAVNGSAGRVGTPFTLGTGATVTLHLDGRLDYDPTTSSTLARLGPGQSAFETFTYTISDGRDAFDSATVRIEVAGTGDVSAVGSIDARVVIAPTTTQAHDQVAVLPDNELWIHEWRPFAVEIWVRVTGQGAAGVASAATRLEFNTAYFSVVDVNAGSAFADDFSFTTNESSGHVDLGGSVNSSSPVGVTEFVLLASVEFEAIDNDAGVPIGLDETGPIQPVTDTWINLAGPTSITISGGASVSQIDQTDPTTELWPLLYDLDDDSRISFGDFAIFSSAFLADASQSPTAAKSDFDASGSVTFGDLALFSANFLINRSAGETISLPTNFPDAFRSATSSASSAPSPTPLALAADEGGSAAVASTRLTETQPTGEAAVELAEKPPAGAPSADQSRLAMANESSDAAASLAYSESVDQPNIAVDLTASGSAGRDRAGAATDVAIRARGDDEITRFADEAMYLADAGADSFDLSLLDDLYADIGRNGSA